MPSPTSHGRCGLDEMAGAKVAISSEPMPCHPILLSRTCTDRKLCSITCTIHRLTIGLRAKIAHEVVTCLEGFAERASQPAIQPIPAPSEYHSTILYGSSAARVQESVMHRPFPGMDPFLEISGDWRDFHARFLSGRELTGMGMRSKRPRRLRSSQNPFADHWLRTVNRFRSTTSA